MSLNVTSDYYVYALVDPINKVPFYIGKGKNKRAWDHVRGYDKANSKKVRYIANIRSLGCEPEIHIIKNNLTNEQAREFETSCIRFGRTIRQPLTNCRLEEGTHDWSEESRKKLSATQKRKGVKPPSRKGIAWKNPKWKQIDRQWVLDSLGSGLTKKSICESLNVSFHTLKKVINNV